jgi:hypothetical protein
MKIFFQLNGNTLGKEANGVLPLLLITKESISIPLIFTSASLSEKQVARV